VAQLLRGLLDAFAVPAQDRPFIAHQSTDGICGNPALQEQEGELTVVATGPLTNIALAAKVDEQFAQRGACGFCRAPGR
jgi:inosine-uridine nucleoside N-ribohydrolase